MVSEREAERNTIKKSRKKGTPISRFPQFVVWHGRGVSQRILGAQPECVRGISWSRASLVPTKAISLRSVGYSQAYEPLPKHPASLSGCGSKNRYQNGTLASGNMDQNLRNPPWFSFEPQPSKQRLHEVGPLTFLSASSLIWWLGFAVWRCSRLVPGGGKWWKPHLPSTRTRESPNHQSRTKKKLGVA